MKTPVAPPSRCAGFEQKLAGYSTAAAAAFALAPAAVAQTTITNITTFSYDSGVTFVTTAPDFQFGSDPGGLPFATGNHQAAFNILVRAGTWGRYGSIHGDIARDGVAAIKLAVGNAIAGQSFYRAWHELAIRTEWGSNFGSFLPDGPYAAATGYIGFKNVVGDQTYFGWLRVKVTNGDNGLPFEVSLVPKAGTTDIYGAVGLASSGITAGQTATAVPEPASVATGLALFALGAAGVREHRRRRKLAA